MPSSNITTFDNSDNLNAAANKISAIESLSRQMAEMRVEAGSEGGKQVSEYDTAAMQEAIKSLAQGALKEIEQALEAHPTAPALHVVA